jgi:hypothetical protein
VNIAELAAGGGKQGLFVRERALPERLWCGIVWKKNHTGRVRDDPMKKLRIHR